MIELRHVIQIQGGIGNIHRDRVSHTIIAGQGGIRAVRNLQYSAASHRIVKGAIKTAQG
ncbi:Uncharacterised protein [Yersinia rohdei]|nr:Uncharacterised protein [Yersinia rohdei]